MLIPLRELNALAGDNVDKVLSSFECAMDADIEFFLQRRAVEFEHISKARTFLVCSEEKIREGKIFVVAYFALSMKTLILPEDMSVRNRKEYDGFRGKIHGEPLREISCYLIGQLARNSSVSKDAISGAELIDLAMAVIKVAFDAVGGRWALIECHNDERLISFYKKNHFQHILDEPHQDVPMVQMVRKIS